MSHNHLQSELRNLVAEALLDEVLQKLRQVFKNDSQKLNEATLLYSRHRIAITSHRKGLVKVEDYNQQILQLINSILELIDEITEEEAIAYELENSIFTKILIVCKNKARKTVMTQLLSDQFYKGVQFDTSGVILPDDEVNKFQLILFDNMDNTDETYFELYKHYLANTAPYLLYFGKGQVPDSNGKKVKAYFANSIFSLHSRIQEMLTFLKYYKES